MRGLEALSSELVLQKPHLRIVDSPLKNPEMSPLHIVEENGFDDFGFDAEEDILDLSEQISNVFAVGEIISSNIQSIKNMTESGVLNFNAPKVFDFSRKSQRYEIVDTILINSASEVDRIKQSNIARARQMQMMCCPTEISSSTQISTSKNIKSNSSGVVGGGSALFSGGGKDECCDEEESSDKCQNCGTSRKDGNCPNCG